MSYREEVIEAGINLTSPTMRARITAAENAGTAKYKAAVEAQNSLRPRWAVSISELAVKIQSYVSVMFVMSFVLAGLCIAVVLQFVAEYQSVEAGLAIAMPELAPLLSAAIVLLFIVLLFIRSLTERTAVRPLVMRFSLRTTVHKLLYFLGLFELEAKEQKTPLQRMDSTIYWLMLSIVVAGFLGRLAGLLEPTNGISWQDGLTMLVKSDLQNMISLVLSPIITLALLTSTEFVVMWMSQLFNALTGGISFEAFLSSGSDVPSLATYQEIERELLYQTIATQHKLKQAQAQLPVQIEPSTES